MKFIALCVVLVSSRCVARAQEGVLPVAWMSASGLAAQSREVALPMRLFSASRASTGPEKANWELLEKTYNEAAAPARLADFDVMGKPSKQRCVITSKKVDRLYEIKIKRLVKTHGGGGGNGPLFPPVPPVVVEKLMTWTVGTDSQIWGIFDLVEITSDKSDLIFHVGPTPLLDDAPLTVRFRKNGDLVAFRGVNYEGLGQESILFGYCYRDNAP